MAGAEIIEIEIEGRSGHGAAPHQVTDPVLASAQIISSLQSVISRNIDPLESAVVSVTQVTAGDSYNVIPSKVLMRGTIRTFDPEVREIVLKRVEEIVKGVAEAMGCFAKLRIERLSPPVINDPIIAKHIATTASQWFPEITIDSNTLTMVSEDMAFFLDTIPGCFILMGSNDPVQGPGIPHHNSHFDFDESVLPRAAALLAIAAWNFLESM